MNNFTGQLIRIKDIAAMFYKSGKVTDTLVIYGRGAPVTPDNGNLPEATILNDYPVDLLVPDYIGTGRSGGKCTPLNCIKTFLVLYEQLQQGGVATNFYQNKKMRLKYRRIICIGRSFGGTYIPLLPRYNSQITELGLIFPAIDNPSCGSISGEESNQDFMNAMLGDGYKYLYRGITRKVWQEHLEGHDNLLPAMNIEYLEKSRLFIGHGKEDQLIHYSKSEKYFKLLQQKLNKNQSAFVLYPGSGHDNQTAINALKDCLNWFEVN